MKFPLSGGIVIHDVTVAVQLIFIGDKTFQTNGTSGMDLTRADPYLGTEAVTEAVCKPC
jgi:hypothetical protein